MSTNDITKVQFKRSKKATSEAAVSGHILEFGEPLYIDGTNSYLVVGDQNEANTVAEEKYIQAVSKSIVDKAVYNTTVGGTNHLTLKDGSTIVKVNYADIENNNGETLDSILSGDLGLKMDKNNPSGTGSLSMNGGVVGSNKNSTALGANTTASGTTSFASGVYAEATGNYAHAEGQGTSSNKVTASGAASHAEGYKTQATGNYAHAEGNTTVASGSSSHAEGNATAASGDNSHAEGLGTTAKAGQHVQGKYNVADSNTPVFADIVGWGSSTSNRKNISQLTTNGTLYLTGDVYVGNSGDGGTSGEALVTATTAPKELRYITEDMTYSQVSTVISAINQNNTSNSLLPIFYIPASVETGNARYLQYTNKVSYSSGGSTLDGYLFSSISGATQDATYGLQYGVDTAIVLSTHTTSSDSNVIINLDEPIMSQQYSLQYFIKKPQYVNYTMLAQVWEDNTGTYPLETTYPKANYDVEVMLDHTATAAQANAFIFAIIVGGNENDSTNTFYSMGTYPGVDIPVVLKVTAR